MCIADPLLKKTINGNSNFGRAVAPILRPLDIKSYDRAGRVPLSWMKRSLDPNVKTTPGPRGYTQLSVSQPGLGITPIVPVTKTGSGLNTG